MITFRRRKHKYLRSNVGLTNQRSLSTAAYVALNYATETSGLLFMAHTSCSHEILPKSIMALGYMKTIA